MICGPFVITHYDECIGVASTMRPNELGVVRQRSDGCWVVEMFCGGEWQSGMIANGYSNALDYALEHIS
jgi:hypothetical protein